MATPCWNKESTKAYKESGDAVRAIGGKPMRDLFDKDVNAMLTFWAVPRGLIITQVFLDTADVVYYRDTTPDSQLWQY